MKLSRKGSFFQKRKNGNFFPSLATSGRHNSAMITDRRKFFAKWSLYGICLVSIFTLESIQTHSLGLYTPYKKAAPNSLRREFTACMS